MKKVSTVIASALTVLAMTSAYGQVTAPNPFKVGYVLDSGGSFIMNSSGLCWHTAQWTAALAVEPCDPTIKAVTEVAPVPRAVLPAPIPAQPVAITASGPASVAAPMVAGVDMPQKISFSGDAMFAFDKAVLQPEGRILLDSLVRQLTGANYENIVVTGHTDRIGSTWYNQKLSEQRAQTVKDYLVNQNILFSRIDAMGMGETQTVINEGDCKEATRDKVIACLQPDRRVDIEMKGTKSN